jgi:tetratricopeptide (TPR) repeat protein
MRSRLVARVAQSLDAGLEVPPGVAEAPPSSPESVDLLLRAKSLLLQPQTAETMAAARRLLDTAMQQDRRSAEAIGELASIHLAEALSGRSPDPRQDLARAKQLIDAAITAEPGNPQALALRGGLLRLQRKPEEALAAYQAAIAANPSFADAHAEIGRLKIDFGPVDEALASIKTALQLSPLDPQRALWSSFAGMALLFAGRQAEAIPWLEKSAALDPHFVNPQVWLSAAYALDGQGDKASNAVKTVLRLSPKLTIARIERQLDSGDPRGREQLSPVLDALKRAGLPD